MTQMMIKSPSAGGDYATTAKFIEGENPVSQSYSKDDLWAGSGNVFTFAGFYRVPTWLNNGGTFIKSTNFDITFRYWYDAFRKCRFDIDLYTPGFSSEYRIETEDLYPSLLTIGDWFCLMFSIDTSPVGDPTRSCWLHKTGETVARNLYTNAIRDNFPAGPGTAFDFDDTSSKWTLGSNLIDPNRGQDYEQSDVYISNEYVNWNDANERSKIVDANGKPISLGVDGSLLTGNAAKIYVLGGDGTDNKGTAGDFTAINGPIVDADTSPSD